MITRESTNYTKWAFILLIIALFLAIIEYLIILFSHQIDLDFFLRILNITGLGINIMLLGGITLMVLAIIKREEKKHLFYINIIGYSLLTIQTILLLTGSTNI